MASSFDFSGRKVLVTGGTRGIGRALVQAFHEAGAELIITGTDPVRIEGLRQEHQKAGLDRIEYMAVDFADPASLAAFLRDLEALPRLDVCVNNAGMNRNNTLDRMDLTDLDRILQVNLRAPMLICRALCRVMSRNLHGGRIVNLSSIWSVIAKEGRSAYGTAKAGIASFSRHIAVDLAPSGILVNAVSPGFTMTELTESMLSPQEIQSLAAQVPLGRIADPAEMAKAILFLCSDLNTFITGQNIVVDGGFTIV